MDWDYGLHIVEKLSVSDLVIAPWLYWQGETERLTHHQTSLLLTRIAERLTRQRWRKTCPPDEWTEYSVTTRLAKRAVYETLTSTAAYLTNLRLVVGRLNYWMGSFRIVGFPSALRFNVGFRVY